MGHEPNVTVKHENRMKDSQIYKVDSHRYETERLMFYLGISLFVEVMIIMEINNSNN